MKTIALYNHKGGTGKTILSLLLARYLKAAGKRVLLIDLDPQGSASGILSRMEDQDLDLNRHSLPLVNGDQLPMDLATSLPSGLDLIPAVPALSEAQSTAVVPALKTVLKGSPWDYCIIDNSPRWGLLPQAAMTAADILLIPSLVSLDDSEKSLETLKAALKMDVKKIWIVFNQLTGRGGREDLVLEHYKDQGKDHICPYSIPESSLIRSWTDQGEPISKAKNKQGIYNPVSRISELLGCKIQPEKF